MIDLVRLATYSLAVSALYAALAVVAPEVARAAVILFVAMLVVPSVVWERANARRRRGHDA